MSKAQKADRHRKTHLSIILRNDPRRFRILIFAQTLAAKRIQSYFRTYIEYKKQREAILFEQAKKRILKNYARATIRKYARIYLLEKKEKKEQIEYHSIYHLPEIVYMQTKWRAWKTKPKKINVRRFREVFLAVLQGWRIRRILSYLKTLPDVKEAIDFIKLKFDLEDHNPNDAFSKQIISQYPEKLEMFQFRFNDLYENVVWIKKPTSKPTERQRKPFITANTKKDVTNNKQKSNRGTQKSTKAPLEKSKTFKQSNTAKTKLKTNHSHNLAKTMRKHNTERQPKQCHIPQKSSESPIQRKLESEKPKINKHLAPQEKITLHLDQSSKIPMSKSNRTKYSASTTRYNPHSELLSIPKGTSFGLLAQKNQNDQSKLNRSHHLDDSPVQESRRQNTITNALSVLNFHNVRKSYDPQITCSFKEPQTMRNDKERLTRESIMNRKRPELDNIKFIPLQERRSQTRQMRTSTLTKNEENTPVKIILSSIKMQELPNKFQETEQPTFKDESFEVNEGEQLCTYALFSKIVAGALERLGGDEALQLACLEE
jgi:hypothetical protein